MDDDRHNVVKTIGLSVLVGVVAAGVAFLLIRRPHLRGGAAAIARTVLQVAEHLIKRS